MEFITPQQMAEEEKGAVAKGVTIEALMENAGRAVAEEIRRRFASLEDKKVVIIAGTGNNGGDSMVAARYLSHMNASCTVVLLGTPSSLKTDEARKNLDRLSGTSVKVYSAATLSELARLSEAIENADIVLAAIFGTGIRGPIREPQAEAISVINRSRGFVVAVDVPSGLDPLTGDVGSVCVKADLTVTLHRAKVGLRERREYTGELVVAPIGID